MIDRSTVSDAKERIRKEDIRLSWQRSAQSHFANSERHSVSDFESYSRTMTGLSYFPFLTRVTLVGGKSAISESSSVRLTDCHVNLSSSTRRRMLVCLRTPPSLKIPVASKTQWSPSRCQSASPKPPSASKAQE